MQPMNDDIFDEGKIWVLDIFQVIWPSPIRGELQVPLWNMIVFDLQAQLERELEWG